MTISLPLHAVFRRYGLSRATRTLLMLALSLAAVLPASAQPSAQETDTLASYAPAGSLMYLEIELAPDSEQAALASDLLERANLESLIPQGDLADIEAMLEPTRAGFEGQAAIFLGPNPDLEGLDTLLGDAMVMAEDPLAGTAGTMPTGWGALLRATDPEQLLADLLADPGDPDPGEADRVIDPNATPVASDMSVTSEEYAGFEITSHSPEAGSAGASFALVEGVVVVAATPEDVRMVIDVVAGDTESLAGSVSFAEVRDVLPENVLAAGFIDGLAIGSSLLVSGAAGLDDVGVTDLAQLGARTGFALWAEEEGFRMESRTIPLSTTEFQDQVAYGADLAGQVPGEAMFFAGGMDLGAQPALEAAAYAIALQVIGMEPGWTTPPASHAIATPAVADMTIDQVFAQAEAELGINLRTDVLDQLTGEWAIAGTFDLSTTAAVFMSGVQDEATATGVLGQLTEAITTGTDDGVLVTTRLAGTTEVTVVEFGDDVAPLTLEYGVLEGQVVLGLNGWLDAVTNTSPVLTLEDEQTFQATLAALPAPFTSLTFVNLERVIPVIEEAVAAFSGGGVIDADPACAEFESQEAAQAAYDESFENYMLDLDWDGEACEDHFTAATPAGAPDGSVNVLSFGAVTSVDNGAMVTSAVLLIGA